MSDRLRSLDDEIPDLTKRGLDRLNERITGQLPAKVTFNEWFVLLQVVFRQKSHEIFRDIVVPQVKAAAMVTGSKPTMDDVLIDDTTIAAIEQRFVDEMEPVIREMLDPSNWQLRKDGSMSCMLPWTVIR